MYSASQEEEDEEDCSHLSTLLLNHPEINPHMTSKDGRTLLIYAACGNNTKLMHRLLDEHHFEANAKDKAFRTALSHAAGEGSKDIVELLLRRDDVDINSRDRHSRTPLSHALISAVDEESDQSSRDQALETAELLRQHGGIVDGPDLLNWVESDDCAKMWQCLYG
ncbi:ankyrin repeat-containing domain protein [Mycena epipterygia]|nr:ankyrin repeat-containing domain protein [Mycena epipterygia]